MTTCLHENRQGSENWDDLNISFCKDCGSIVVTTWNQKTRRLENEIFISPMRVYDMYEILSNLSQTIEEKKFNFPPLGIK